MWTVWVSMTEEDTDKEGMAECGACRAVVPVDSTECPGCGVSFTGVSDTSLGECGACGALVPLDSRSCPQCGVVFVADNVIEILADWLNATGLSVVDLFKRFDTNEDGVIEAQEFKTGLLALNIADLPESQVNRLVDTLDEDGNGVIDLQELESTFKPPDNKPSKEVGPEDEEEEPDDEEEASEEEESDDQEEASEEEISDDQEEDSEDDAPEGAESEVEDEEDDLDGEEEAEEDQERDDSEEEDDDSEDEDEEIPDTPLGRMVKSFKDAGYNAQAAFEHMDVNNDGQIDKEELNSALTQFGGGVISDDDVDEVMSEVDFDENGSISIEELVIAFGETFESEEEKSGDEEKDDTTTSKEFPSDLQKKLMSKKANDVFWPIMHALFGLFMVLWIANGLGIFVSGEGGTIQHTGDSFVDADGVLINEGDTTTCDPAVHDCANSLTPLAGNSGLLGSMPAGFYWDGILMIILGAIGLGGSLYAHLVLMKQWREKAKGDSTEENESDDDDSDKKDSDDEVEDKDSDDSEDSDDDDDSDDESDEDEESEYDDYEDSDDDEDSDEESDDDEDTEDDEEDDDEGEDIDVGSRVGVELDGEEIFGTILEFDDDSDIVIIEDEETGDEIEAPQDSMFLE